MLILLSKQSNKHYLFVLTCNIIKGGNGITFMCVMSRFRYMIMLVFSWAGGLLNFLLQRAFFRVVSRITVCGSQATPQLLTRQGYSQNVT